MIEYKLQGANGQDATVDSNYVLSQFGQAGFNPQGISADGQMLTLVDDQGPYQVKVADALKEQGWAVQTARPLNADYDNIQHGWRAAISKLDTDDMRQAFIEGQMKRAGVEQPTVIGNGRDWYVFNPATSQYIGVTNNPEWDMSDLTEAAVEAPRMIASAFGGAVAGPLGAGGGGLAADAATRGLMAGAGELGESEFADQYLPGFAQDALKSFSGYNEALQSDPGAYRGRMAFDAALDAGTMGLFKYAPSVARTLFGQGGESAARAVTEAAPVSRMMQGAGQTMNMTGRGLSGVAGALDNSLGRNVATFGIPGAAETQALGFIAQAPRWLAGAPVRAAGMAGESELLQQATPRFAQGLRDFSRKMTYNPNPARAASDVAQEGAERVASKMNVRPTPEVYGPAQKQAGVPYGSQFSAEPSVLLENMFRHGYRGLSDLGMRASHAMRGSPVDKDIYKMVRQFGISPEEARRVASQVPSRNMDQAARLMEGSKNAGELGRRTGRLFEDVARFGRGAEQFAEGAGGAVVKGAKGVGQGMAGTGAVLRGAGTLARPLEGRGYVRYGLEETLGPGFEESNPWRRRPTPSMMGLDLAQN